MKRIAISLLCFIVCALSVSAQHKFDPEKFRAELHRYIVAEAQLTPAEEKKFFPLYDEMRDKQRALHKKTRAIRKQNPTSESACRSAIVQRDNLEVQMREIERTYHQKFFKVLPATKVYQILVAEEKFQKRTFKRLRNK